MKKYERRQRVWKIIATVMIMLGTGTVLGIEFDTELFPILMKAIVGCAMTFTGMFMILYLGDGLENQCGRNRQ